MDLIMTLELIPQLEPIPTWNRLHQWLFWPVESLWNRLQKNWNRNISNMVSPPVWSPGASVTWRHAITTEYWSIRFICLWSWTFRQQEEPRARVQIAIVQFSFYRSLFCLCTVTTHRMIWLTFRAGRKERSEAHICIVIVQYWRHHFRSY